MLIGAALDSVADLLERHYQREHDVEKRVLDVVRLGQAAERLGLSTLPITPEIRVVHDDARALLIFKNMSSRLLYLDRAVTNRKPLTKWILARAGVPVARGSEAGTADEVREAFTALDTVAVVKPVTGSGGRDVSTHISTAEQAAGAAAPILESGRNVLVEEMIAGIDLRVTVVNDRAVGATLRVPANVIGDGRSTIAALAEAKNALRSTSDYTRHQLIEFGADTERYLNAREMTPETVPAPRQRVFLHYVANISAGGDSYEVLDRLHPQVADLAVRAAALFPSSLHAGIDLLLERFDAQLSTQRAVVCEVNLNNELPMHLYPLYGPTSPVDDIEMAAHWGAEARIPFSAWRQEDAPSRVRLNPTELEHLDRDATTTPPDPSASGYSDLRDLGRTFLQAALDAAAPPGTSATVTEDTRFVHLRAGDSVSIAERSGRSLIAGAVGADPAVMHRIARTSGIPVLARHALRGSQREKAAELADRAWRTWQMHSSGHSPAIQGTRISTRADLDAAWEKIPRSGQVRLVETPTETACVLLMDGTSMLASQLLVPLTLTGDGTATTAALLDQAMRERQDHPVLGHYCEKISTANLLAGTDPGAVLDTGQRLQLGRSPRLSDGAATLGLSVLPWPGLEQHAARFMKAIDNPGIATVTFVPRRRSRTEATWALWRFHSDPTLALFRFPLRGTAYDSYSRLARRIVSGPAREV